MSALNVNIDNRAGLRGQRPRNWRRTWCMG